MNLHSYEEVYAYDSTYISYSSYRLAEMDVDLIRFVFCTGLLTELGFFNTKQIVFKTLFTAEITWFRAEETKQDRTKGKNTGIHTLTG